MRCLYIALVSVSFCFSYQTFAQNERTSSTPERFKKENVYGGAWSKQIFADASVIQGPHKMLFIAGMAAEDPATGKVMHADDFTAQCEMAYKRIRKILEDQGGNMYDIVRTVAFVTDMRYRDAYIACQKKALAGAPLPPHTLVCVSELAQPGMLVEVDVTAAIPLKN